MNSNRDNFNNNFNINTNNSNNANIDMSSMSGSIAPPLPPRPNQLSSNTNNYRFGGYGSNGFGFGQQFGSYSSMYCNPYNGLTPYGNYGYNRFNNYGNNNSYYGINSQENDFVRVAEDSSRQAFQSIESIVQAFGSVSMMLESTYYAVHSSFRAVIGVADHFSRLRQHLAQILSTLAIIRTFKWIIRRLLYLIGIRRYNSMNETEEKAWTHASNSNPIVSHLTPDGTFDTSELFSRGRSSWPIIIFFGVVLGTPWLIWRLLSTISGNDKTGKSLNNFFLQNFDEKSIKTKT
jgi:peroxin-13